MQGLRKVRDKSKAAFYLTPAPRILAPPVSGRLEIPKALLGAPEPSESSNSGEQLFVGVPQVPILDPEQDNGKWLWEDRSIRVR